MNTNLRFWKTAIILVLLSSIIFGVAGCNNFKEKPKKGISFVSFWVATGNRENTNCISLVNDYGRAEPKYSRYDLMTGETAMKLIEEIKMLPDLTGNEDDQFAYRIRLEYYDENTNFVSVEKYGYAIFPDNWNEIVSDFNDISDRNKLTYCTDIVTIDADLLRNEFGMSDDMFPEGVTVEKYLEDTGLTYLDLYLHGFDVDYHVQSYRYDYYDLVSHRIFDDTVAQASDRVSLEEYAERNLDTVDSSDDISIRGTFDGYDLEIVRFDCYDEWKIRNDVNGSLSNTDGTVDIIYDADLHMEGISTYDVLYIYIDPSYRFLILTRCDDLDVINEYFNR
ncbi:MAG: hypothetical protein J5685_06120 [Clostridiales bacterium]|nr:hypothetical protein [Clostridiales bacterium]